MGAIESNYLVSSPRIDWRTRSRGPFDWWRNQFSHHCLDHSLHANCFNHIASSVWARESSRHESLSCLLFGYFRPNLNLRWHTQVLGRENWQSKVVHSLPFLACEHESTKLFCWVLMTFWELSLTRIEQRWHLDQCCGLIRPLWSLMFLDIYLENLLPSSYLS